MKARAGSLEDRLRVPNQLSYPASHLGLRWSDLGAEDVDAVLDLFERCEQLTDADSIVKERRVARYLSAGELTDDVHHAIGGRDSHGVLRGFGMATALAGTETVLRAELRAVIDPSWRNRGIGRALLDWQDGRARQLLAEDGRDLPVSIETRVDSHNTEQRRLVAAAGFSPVRKVEEHTRTIEAGEKFVDPVIDAQLGAADVKIISFDKDLSEEVRVVRNRTETLSRGGRVLRRRDFERRVAMIDESMSFLAITDEDSPIVVGFLLAGLRYGGEGAWIEFAGVERAWRSKGIGDALMAYHFDAVADKGLTLSSLEIDSGWEPGLASWFTSWDFFPRTTDIVYAIEV